MLDHHLSSLNADIREVLICRQDWMQMESEGWHILILAYYVHSVSICFAKLFFLIYQTPAHPLAIWCYQWLWKQVNVYMGMISSA